MINLINILTNRIDLLVATFVGFFFYLFIGKLVMQAK